MPVKCVVKNFKHFLTVAPTTTFVVKVAYCPKGLHETNVELKDENDSEDHQTTTERPEGGPAKAMADWLECYASIHEMKNPQLPKIPPICKLSVKDGKGESHFEQSIWAALQNHVQPGETVTYGKLAEMAVPSVKAGEGRRYARAVGQIMRRNPFSLIRACHRVIPSSISPGTSQSYGTYGGVAHSKLKRAILEFEVQCKKAKPE